MFQTITDVQKAEAINLQQYIDNRNGDLRIGLRSILFTVGWYNTSTNEGFGYIKDDDVKAIQLPVGLWNFQDLQTFMDTEFTDFANIDLCKANGIITLTVKREKITMSPGMSDILGMDLEFGKNKGWFELGVYIGNKPVNFLLTKTLRVHLKQLNSSYNICDGAPSSLLKIVNSGNSYFGEAIILDYSDPEFKKLNRGCITELDITIRDDKDIILNNQEYQISIVLEIK